MSDPIAYNPEAEAAAARARASTFRFTTAAATRKRHRIVTDRATGEAKVVTEEAHDPVPDALAAYWSHALFAPSTAAELPERHGLNDEETARFWRAVAAGRR